MFQIIALWNITRPDEYLSDIVKNIKLRGYKYETFLTGEFAMKVKIKIELTEDYRNGRINREEYMKEVAHYKAVGPLSVSCIVDRYCPTRVDLYLEKGLKKPKNIKKRIRKTWGIIAGHFVEKYICKYLVNKVRSIDISNESGNYSTIISFGLNAKDEYLKQNKNRIEKMREIEEQGDSDWLLKLLDVNGRAELSIRILHSILKEDKSLDISDLRICEKIHPNPVETGISSPVEPDFIIPEYGIVGDIKTGTEFKPFYQLTCAGYAIAYENQHKEDINWGVIYFFPTRNPSLYVRPLTFAQVYFFPIDDYLRQWFINERDNAYNIITKDKPPNFPPEEERKHCKHCKFKEICESMGLKIPEKNWCTINVHT